MVFVSLTKLVLPGVGLNRSAPFFVGLTIVDRAPKAMVVVLVSLQVGGADRLGAPVTAISSADNVAVIPPPQVLRARSDHRAEGCTRGEHGNAVSEREGASHCATGWGRQQRRAD